MTLWVRNFISLQNQQGFHISTRFPFHWRLGRMIPVALATHGTITRHTYGHICGQRPSSSKSSGCWDQDFWLCLESTASVASTTWARNMDLTPHRSPIPRVEDKGSPLLAQFMIAEYDKAFPSNAHNSDLSSSHSSCLRETMSSSAKTCSSLVPAINQSNDL